MKKVGNLHQFWDHSVIQHIPVVPKDKCAMHVTTRYIVKKPNQFIKCLETRVLVTDFAIS